MPVLVCALIVALALGVPTALGQAPALLQLGLKDGVQTVTGVVQDDAGMLWASTTNGLFSYDGQHFRRYAEADGLSDAPITFVVANQDGIWAATTNRIHQKLGDRFVSRFDSAAIIRRMFGDGKDRIYFVAPYLHVASRGKVVSDPSIQPTTPLSRGHNGDLWYACGMALCKVEATSIEGLLSGNLQSPLPVRTYGMAQGVPQLQWQSVTSDKDGTIWAQASGDHAVWHSRVNASFNRLQTPADVIEIQLDRSGSPLVLGAGWLGTWADGKLHFASTAGPYYLRSVYEDAEHTFWIGASSPGLWRWNRHPGVESIGGFGGRSNVTYQITRRADGEMLTSGEQGVYRIDAKAAKLIPLGNGLPKSLSFAVEAVEDGDVLAGYESLGLVRIDRSGRMKKVVVDHNGKPLVAVRHIKMGRDGVAWISTKSALYRLEPRSNQAVPIALAPGKADYRDIQIGGNGDVWVAFEKGLGHYSASSATWEVLTVRDGLLADFVRCITEDKEGNLWIGYRMPRGFARLSKNNGRWVIRNFDSAGGFGSNSTFFLKTDSRGWLWRGTNDGIHVARTPTDDPGDWLHLTVEDGMPHNDVVNYSFFEAEDGTVWFGTSLGLGRFTPQAVEEAFQRRIHLRIARGNVEGNALKAELRPIVFSHLDRLQYRYRIAGTEEAWRTSWSEKLEVRPVPYGNQSLEVQARRPGTVWSSSAVFDFVRPLPWWRSTPALAAYVMVLLALLAWPKLRQRQFDMEKALFMEVAEMPAQAQRVRLAQAPKRVAQRVRELLAARPAATFAEPLGVLLNGRYRVDRRLASGGMATIYSARDERLSGRMTAIKILRPDIGDAEWLARRFEQERQALGRIQHPGVISVIDVGETPQGLAFLAIEFVEGPTLRERLREGPLSMATAAKFLLQASEALEAAHRAGVTHRDLKPENLMIRAPGTAQERLVIVDFGIAIVRGNDEGTLVLSKAAGSLHYMAPEQSQGRITPACDLFALGLIVFEMITGEQAIPMGLGSGGDLPAGVLHHLRAKVSGDAAALLASALQYDPAARPGSTGEWGRQLAALLAT